MATPLLVTLTVPLCPRRCGHCDLPVHTGDEASTAGRQAYAQALLTEIAAMDEELAGYEIHAVRFAGGAANHLGGPILAQLLHALAARAPLAPRCEVSLACVPTGVSIGLLEDLSHRWRLRLEIEYGTSDALLHESLGRWFAVGAPYDAAAVARAARRPDFDFDVLYGLEGQGIPALRASIDTAARLGATHITLRHLRLTPGTTVEAAWRTRRDHPSASPRHQFPDAEKCAQLHDAAIARLQELGYRRYTDRHFALPGHEAQRVLLEQAGVDHMGFGAGAQSCYAGVTCQNTTDIARYRAGSGDFRQIMVACASINGAQA